MQNIVTDGKGLKIPIQKLKKSVTEVIVMDTAASLNICAILRGTGSFIDVRRQAASITNVSSIPIPEKKLFISIKDYLKNVLNSLNNRI